MNSSYKIPVSHTSIETLQEQGIDVHDAGHTANNFYSELIGSNMMAMLTEKQRRVVSELLLGKSRQEIANSLIISEQEVHQIIPRIRKRLHKKAGISLIGWKRRHGGF